MWACSSETERERDRQRTNSGRKLQSFDNHTLEMAPHCLCHILLIRSEDYPRVQIPGGGARWGPQEAASTPSSSVSVLVTAQAPLLTWEQGWDPGVVRGPSTSVMERQRGRRTTDAGKIRAVLKTTYVHLLSLKPLICCINISQNTKAQANCPRKI